MDWVFGKTLPWQFFSNLKNLFENATSVLMAANHINEKNSKANKGIGITEKFYNILPRNSLITIYKSSIDFTLTFGSSFFESVQYNAALAVTGVMGGSSSEKFFKK